MTSEELQALARIADAVEKIKTKLGAIETIQKDILRGQKLQERTLTQHTHWLKDLNGIKDAHPTPRKLANVR